MVEVFRADWGGDGYGSIQRVRLSPTETMLAATVKKDNHEETRCMLVHLGGVNLHQNAMLVLDNVLSFGKIYYTLIVIETFLRVFPPQILTFLQNGPQMMSSSTAHRRLFDACVFSVFISVILVSKPPLFMKKRIQSKTRVCL